MLAELCSAFPADGGAAEPCEPEPTSPWAKARGLPSRALSKRPCA